MNKLLEGIQNGATPPLEEILTILSPHLPWLDNLEYTPQDPIWHAEGNVLMHTSKVLEQVYRILETPPLVFSSESSSSYEPAVLEPARRLALVLGAVLHDIGKTVTTRVREDGRIVSPRHPEKGRSYAALKLLELEVPFPVWKDVLALIGHHHDPLRLVRDDAPLSRYMRLARLCDLELVYLLERADLLGRVSLDTEEQLEHLDYFQLTAEINGLWKTDPYAQWKEHVWTALEGESEDLKGLTLEGGILDFEAGTIFTVEEAVARGYRFRQGFADLTITVGPSGSGKSVWLRENAKNAEVISLDALREELTGDSENQSQNGRVQQLARVRLKTALAHKKSVVWEATSTRFDLRLIPTRLGFDYGARVRYVVFTVPERQLFTRNFEREHPVPAGVLSKQVKDLEFPFLDEAHHTVYVDEFGKKLGEGLVDAF